jgi:hypothetical protein
MLVAFSHPKDRATLRRRGLYGKSPFHETTAKAGWEQFTDARWRRGPTPRSYPYP